MIWWTTTRQLIPFYLLFCSYIGDVGEAIDSRGILTDYAQDRLPYLTFSQTMDICSYLKGIGERLV